MLRWVILAVVVVVLTVAATLVGSLVPASGTKSYLPVAPVKTGPAPKAAVDGELTHEFGSMPQESEGKHSWTIKNDGEGDLELWKGTSTCMCTFAKFKDGEKAVLKPGESTDIDVVWKTNHTNGDFRKGANIETNDPNLASIPLFVHGKVNPPIVLMPGEAVDMHAVDSLNPKTVFVALYSPDRPETKITEIKTSKPGLLIAEATSMSEEDLKLGKIKAGHKVHIKVKQGFPIGTMREEVVIHTDHPLRPEIKITVVGSVSGPISVLPERLRMVNVKTSEGATGEITLLVRGGKSVNFEVARKPDRLNVSIEPNDSADRKGRYRVKVDVPKGTAPGYIDEEILIKTDFPDVGELKIPVNILISAG
ncbi:MAG: DUF1573 domain-containing protein [Paludisphaera borealis]|uniref:DUF1573 domain-containing protein n=1 Tax=Paludisphaera borealis TaxID=1387353 RepID=UPI00284C96D9|nr:DUF1573 domain-containing protein [Paludisphaera borealis]MDR3619940.1 DUF1573 domain-containing protein [Paludisphaera borealis]